MTTLGSTTSFAGAVAGYRRPELLVLLMLFVLDLAFAPQMHRSRRDAFGTVLVAVPPGRL